MRHTNLLPAAPQPRSAAGWYLGSQGAQRRTCGAASELRRPDGAPTYQHLRRDQARAGAHAGGLGRPPMTPVSVCCVCRMSTGGPVADQYVHRNIHPLRAIGARATPAGGLRNGRMSWLARSPPSATPPNRPSYRNSATVMYAPRAAPSSPRRTPSTGIRSGRLRTVCMHCSNGSASGPNCSWSQAITHMHQAVP